MTNALGTNFCIVTLKPASSLAAQRYHAWKRSSYEQTNSSLLPSQLLYCNSGHSAPILEGVQVEVQTTNALGKTIYDIPTSQGEQRYHAWRRSSYEQMSRSHTIMHSIATSNKYTIIAAMAMLEGALVRVQMTNALGKIFL